MRKTMKKNSYLNMIVPGQEKKYDLDLWYECEKKVASYMNQGVSMDRAIAYVAKPHISGEEQTYDFYHWIKNRINHKTASIKKEALYYTPVNLSNQSNWNKDDLSEKTHEAKENFQAAKEQQKSSSKEDMAEDAIYKKLRRHVVGLTRLLLESKHIDEATYTKAQGLLTDLTAAIRFSFSKQVKANYIYNASNKFAKLGEPDAAEVLRKFAQEVEAGPDTPPAAQPEGGQAPEQPAAPVAAPAPETEEEPPSERQVGDGKEKVVIPTSDAVKPVRFEDIVVPESDPEHRYDDLSGDIGVADAASKLDEIAGMLADRRVIRLLAEFDIMLDRLGIASMFPELAESQSKLIDAFSYALTRVTKMMGQLANAQQVIENTSDIQNVSPAEESPSPEAPEEPTQ